MSDDRSWVTAELRKRAGKDVNEILRGGGDPVEELQQAADVLADYAKRAAYIARTGKLDREVPVDERASGVRW